MLNAVAFVFAFLVCVIAPNALRYSRAFSHFRARNVSILPTEAPLTLTAVLVSAGFVWLLTTFSQLTPAWIATSGHLQVRTALLSVVALVAALSLVVNHFNRASDDFKAQTYLGRSVRYVQLRQTWQIRPLLAQPFLFALWSAVIIPIALWLYRALQAPGNTDPTLDIAATAWWTTCYVYVAFALALGIVGIYSEAAHGAFTGSGTPGALERQVQEWHRRDCESAFRRAQKRNEMAFIAADFGFLSEWPLRERSAAARIAWLVTTIGEQRIVHLLDQEVARKSSSRFESPSEDRLAAHVLTGLMSWPARRKASQSRDLLDYVSLRQRAITLDSETSTLLDARELLASDESHLNLIAAAVRLTPEIGEHWLDQSTPGWRRMRTQQSENSPTEVERLARRILRHMADVYLLGKFNTSPDAQFLSQVAAVIATLEKAQIFTPTNASLRTESVTLLLLERLSLIEDSELDPSRLTAMQRMFAGWNGAQVRSNNPRSRTPARSDPAWKHLTNDQQYLPEHTLTTCFALLDCPSLIEFAIFEFLACQHRSAKCRCPERFKVFWEARNNQRFDSSSTSLSADLLHERLSTTAVRYYLPSADKFAAQLAWCDRDYDAAMLWGGSASPLLTWDHGILLRLLLGKDNSYGRWSVGEFFSDPPKNRYELQDWLHQSAELQAWVARISVPSHWLSDLQRLSNSISVRLARFATQFEQHEARDARLVRPGCSCLTAQRSRTSPRVWSPEELFRSTIIQADTHERPRAQRYPS